MNKYRSEAMQVIHEDMKDMHELGIINDARMREFDKMCLVQETLMPHESTSSVKTECLNPAIA